MHYAPPPPPPSPPTWLGTSQLTPRSRVYWRTQFSLWKCISAWPPANWMVVININMSDSIYPNGLVLNLIKRSHPFDATERAWTCLVSYVEVKHYDDRALRGNPGLQYPAPLGQFAKRYVIIGELPLICLWMSWEFYKSVGFLWRNLSLIRGLTIVSLASCAI